MQLIRAINKSNKSNNNNQTSSGGNSNKVVIVTPTSVSQQKGLGAPVSPSVALPALKKRTSIVKQSVPPPVPPRGSPRSKSNLISRKRAPLDVARLESLSSLEQSGCQKVKQWLETVEVPARAAMSSPEELEFKSVRKLIESFTTRDAADESTKSCKGRKVSDSSLVRVRVESYDSLVRTHQATLRTSDGGTDSGIDIPARVHVDRHRNRKFLLAKYRFSRDGEFVWTFFPSLHVAADHFSLPLCANQIAPRFDHKSKRKNFFSCWCFFPSINRTFTCGCRNIHSNPIHLTLLSRRLKPFSSLPLLFFYFFFFGEAAERCQLSLIDFRHEEKWTICGKCLTLNCKWNFHSVIMIWKSILGYFRFLFSVLPKVVVVISFSILPKRYSMLEMELMGGELSHWRKKCQTCLP